jgi:hypothetical protein
MNEIELYNCLTRFGQLYELSIKDDVFDLLNNIKKFDSDWKVYNPRKKINRQGLSITSIDGGLSGIPDLDSVYEYNKTNNLLLTESSFNKKTPVYQYCAKWLDFLGDNIGRTHLIRLGPGGYFPIHRDNKTLSISNFRLFVPIENCNYPKMTFVLNREMLNFNHGSMYFMDTCLEHYLFNHDAYDDSTFMVVNVNLTESAVTSVLQHLKAG